jgi:hypothetical protein
MSNGGEFVQGIMQSSQELKAWRAAGNEGCPPNWITLEEFWRLREL